MIFFYSKKWRFSCSLVLLFLSFSCNLAFGQTQSVTGKVLDAETGEPVIGATVVLANSKTSVAAGVGGTFEINVPTGGVLQFNSIGYVSAKATADFSKQMIIKLAPDNTGLSEVVIVDFGTQKKPSVVGDSSTVCS